VLFANDVPKCAHALSPMWLPLCAYCAYTCVIIIIITTDVAIYVCIQPLCICIRKHVNKTYKGTNNTNIIGKKQTKYARLGDDGAHYLVANNKMKRTKEERKERKEEKKEKKER
jgi:hypothetical protein